MTGILGCPSEELLMIFRIMKIPEREFILYDALYAECQRRVRTE